MLKFNYLNYSSAAVLLLLILSMLIRGMTRGKENRLFLAMMVMNFIASLLDSFSVIADNAHTNRGLMVFLHCAYLFIHNSMTPLFMFYIISLTDTMFRLRQRKISFYLHLIPLGYNTILLLTTPFTEQLFYYDQNDTYLHGPLFATFYASTMIYVLLIIWYIIRYRRTLTKMQHIIITFIFITELLGEVWQLFSHEVRVATFVYTLGIMLISITIHRPEEFVDPVTGLDRYGKYVADMKRAFVNHKPCDIIMMNISNYVSVHTILGYEKVCELMRQISHDLMQICTDHGTEAILYYVENGCFRIVIDQDGDNIKPAAEDIARRMKESISFGGMDMSLITYVCIVHCPDDVDDYLTLDAFGSDFHKKLPFTGTVTYASEILEKKHYDIMQEMDEIIDNALANHNFMVYYQPIYSVVHKKFTSAEALLRLKDEKHGFISPEIFIPAAEKNGAIHKIGIFVLEEVCRYIASKEFKECGLEYIEVNLSVAQCMQSGLARNVLEIINRYGVDTRCINLEITETAASFAQNVLMENLKILSEAGIYFSLDDYGTGYSNMQRVVSLPLKIIKLDKTFTDYEKNPKMLIILENTVRMIKDMDMEIVAEGIETLEMANKYAEMKVEYIQGYYYSKPLPETDFTAFLMDNLAKA